jgi:hypothetical protein
MVARFRERLAVSKLTMQRVYMEMFNLKKLKEIEGKEQYQVEISNRFIALANLHPEVAGGTEIKWDTSAAGFC